MYEFYGLYNLEVKETIDMTPRILSNWNIKTYHIGLTIKCNIKVPNNWKEKQT